MLYPHPIIILGLGLNKKFKLTISDTAYANIDQFIVDIDLFTVFEFIDEIHTKFNGIQLILH